MIIWPFFLFFISKTPIGSYAAEFQTFCGLLYPPPYDEMLLRDILLKFKIEITVPDPRSTFSINLVMSTRLSVRTRTLRVCPNFIHHNIFIILKSKANMGNSGPRPNNISSMWEINVDYLQIFYTTKVLSTLKQVLK